MSNYTIPIKPSDMDSLLFKVKKFEYNIYRIEHDTVKGFLRVATIPQSILKIREEALANLPNTVNIEEDVKYRVLHQSIVGFVNHGEKKISKEPWLPPYINSKPKQDLFQYIVKEQTDEPWNEFVIQGEIPVLIRTKTTLTNAYVYPNYYNDMNDPIIQAMHNTSISVSLDRNVESGMP